MFEKKSVIAVVCARAGSKGLPGKNTRLFAGRPLIEWTIKAGLLSHYVDKVIVSTDSQQIADIAKQAGAEVPFLRPTTLAADDTPLSEVLVHCASWLQDSVHAVDYILLLQPTSPLRVAKDIDLAIDYYFDVRKTNEDTLISVKRCSSKMGWLMQANDNGYIEHCFPQNRSTKQRQAFSEYYFG